MRSFDLRQMVASTSRAGVVKKRRLDAITLEVWLLCGCCANASAATVAHWRFDEGAANTTAVDAGSVIDSGPHALHGTPLGNPVYRLVDGRQALAFDGSSKVVVADSSAFNLASAFTLEAILRFEASPETRFSDIVFRGDSRGGLDPYQLYLTSEGKLGVATDTSVDRRSVESAQPVNHGVWTHVAGVYDGATNWLGVYINGALSGSKFIDAGPPVELDPTESPAIGIGGLPGRPEFLFTGLIDQIRISSVALSPSEFIPVPEPQAGVLLTIAAAAQWVLAYRARPLKEKGEKGTFWTFYFSLPRRGLPRGLSDASSPSRLAARLCHAASP